VSNDRNNEAGAVPWWGRFLFAFVGVIVGLLLLGVGFQLGYWWINGDTEEYTTVSCDDDYTYNDDGQAERFQDESGTWCLRTTKEINEVQSEGWPLWLAAPAWVLALAVTLALVVGGVALAVYVIAVTVDRELREDFWGRFVTKR